MTFFLVETYRIGSTVLDFTGAEDHVAVFFSRHAAEDFRDAIGTTQNVPIVAAEPIELLRRFQDAVDAGVASYAVSPDAPSSCFDCLELHPLSNPYQAFEHACQAMAELVDSNVCPIQTDAQPVHVFR